VKRRKQVKKNREKNDLKGEKEKTGQEKPGKKMT